MKSKINPTKKTHAEREGTYHWLAHRGSQVLSELGRSKGHVDNCLTALRAWRRHNSRDEHAALKDDFGAGFDKLFQHFQDVEVECVSPRTLKDRCEQILWWKKTAEFVRGEDALPASFPDALTVAHRRSGLTKAALCREAKMSLPTLDNWLAGKHLPVRASAQLVQALEEALELTPGTLAKRLPPRRKARYARNCETAPTTTTFGKRLAKNAAKLKGEGLTIRVEPTPRLRTQWAQLLQLKTKLTRPGGTRRNTWKLRPAQDCGIRVYWYGSHNSQVCATAQVHYGMVAGYLGFLRLPARHGGLGLRDAVDSLAWLVRADLIQVHVRWVQQRSSGLLHNGLFTIVQNLMSHLRPGTGFVWLHPELARDLPADAAQDLSRAAWEARCAAAHQSLKEFSKELEESGRRTRSRNPKELISQFTGSEFPLKELLKVIRALEQDPPPTSQRRNYATWIRDVLLLTMLSRHPLRANHFSTMRFRGDSPSLVRTADGWHINFDAEFFKNHASSDVRDYYVPCDQKLSGWIDRYLTEARPLMVGADDCDYLYLPSRVGNRSTSEEKLVNAGLWNSDGMYCRVKAVTAMYTPSGIGLSFHSFRHLPASDHLLRNPGDYLTVAKMLNDKLETVLREYDHSGVQAGVRKLQGSVELAERELEERR